MVAAAAPLVRRAGRAVTTAEIARAAGVSEATVFHVFGTKEALIAAVVAREFSSTDSQHLLARIDPEFDLEQRLAAVVRILRERLRSVFELMTVLGMSGPPRVPGFDFRRSRQQFIETVADLLRPDADRLRFSPERAAELVRLITFATAHPALTDGKPLAAQDVADLVLHGILRDEAPVSAPC